MFSIRAAQPSEFDQIWPIIQLIIQSGDTFVFPPDTPKEQIREYWFSKDTQTFVAIADQVIAGTYIIHPNQPGLGSHVASTAFMVHPNHSGKGIGQAMAEHALAEARKAGYLAMQFTVVSTNMKALGLWQKLRFEIVGKLPKVFNHQQLGLVDVYIMHRFL